MSCPYFYKKNHLTNVKLWALKTCTGISPNERQWLQNSQRSSRKNGIFPGLVELDY